MSYNYVCDIHCNECECRTAHKTWFDVTSLGCERCQSKDIGVVKTYGAHELSTKCTKCRSVYRGKTWDETAKSCCGTPTMPLGATPPRYINWYTPQKNTLARRIYDFIMYGRL